MSNYYNRQWRLPNNENKDKQSNYSMDFDGSNQYIELNSSVLLPNQHTISTWIKSDDLTSSAIGYLFTTETTIKGIGLDEGDGSFGAGKFYYWNGGSSTTVSTTAITVNNWHHIVFVFDSTANEIKFYLDGNLDKTTTVTIGTAGSIKTIGSYNGILHYLNGKLDAFSIFDYALSSSQVTTLYGSSSTGIGNPMSLSPKPVAYYPLGDQDSFNGSNYLVPNIAAQEADGDIATSYSPYALDFDGANDYIDLTSDITLSGNRSINMWIKVNTGFSFAVLFGGDTNVFYPYIDTNNIAIRNNDTSTAIAHNGISVGVWYNFCVTGNGTTASFYQNGSLLGTGTDKNLTLKYINTEQAGLYGLNGSISNCSVWNAALTSSQVTEIYNEGVPSNLNNHSAYSNLVSWWQLGSNSSFNTNWTVLDEKGSNNGTSVNMTEADIVDGVGSSANGLSSGMGGDEVIGDAPYSSSNSLSVNMDVLDRVEDTPS